MKSSRIRTILSAIWLLFTISLVSWWFIYVLRNQGGGNSLGEASRYRMLFYEGSTLIITILLGGIVMIFLSHKDDQRHERLKYFFSNFTHDIKTSITRLRLQSDILTEQNEFKNNRVLQRLLSDIARLDLQLENSLQLTYVMEASYLAEEINLFELIQSVQPEFDELKFIIRGNALLTADSHGLRSIFRNLFENSRRHGKATEITIDVIKNSTHLVQIIICDDGLGTTLKKLGHKILSGSQSKGTGIGLFLAKKMIKKMQGSITFSSVAAEKRVSDQAGFKAELILKGKLV